MKICGRGDQTLIFLHAFASSGAAWDAVIDRLHHSHRCVAVDLAGFGGSPDSPPYSVARHAEMVGDLMADNQHRPVFLIGHSMGGKIAAALAATSPAGLAGLILLAPSPPTPEPISADERAERLAAYGDEAAARQTLKHISRRPITTASADRFVADTLACSISAWAWWLEEGSREDIFAATQAISCPMMVIMGDKDPVIPLGAVTHALTTPHPSSALSLIPGAGHWLPEEAPEECARIIADFTCVQTKLQPVPSLGID